MLTTVTILLLQMTAKTAAVQAWTSSPFSFGNNNKQKNTLQQQQQFMTSTSTSSSSSTTTDTSSLTVDPELAQRLEKVVLRYFQGVDQKNDTLIQSCFGKTCIIRDVCALSVLKTDTTETTETTETTAKTVESAQMVERCMDFVTAHPDVKVLFHIPPTCLRKTIIDNQQDSSYWVFAHWYELGTWSGASCGLTPPSPPKSMQVEGQTRFRVCPQTDTIQELVVTRTFTEWEKAFLQKTTNEQKQQEQE